MLVVGAGSVGRQAAMAPLDLLGPGTTPLFTGHLILAWSASADDRARALPIAGHRRDAVTASALGALPAEAPPADRRPARISRSLNSHDTRSHR
jgi:hypothetical protein